MVVDPRRELQDDGINDCRSLGSNSRQSSQSRKVSVGILIDPFANRRYGVKWKDKVVPIEGMEAPRKGNSEEEKDNGEDVSGNEGKISEAPEQITSPWIATLSAHQAALTSKNVLNENETSKLASAGESKRKLSSKDQRGNRSLIMHSDDRKEKLFCGLAYTWKGSKNSSLQREQDFTFPTPLDVPPSDKAVAGEIAEPRTDTFRMQLWEILGTVPSPKSHPSNLKGHDLGCSSSKPEKITNGRNDDPDIWSKQISDPIETDSESPVHSMKRPLTRASTQKRASTKRQCLKSRKRPPAARTQKVQRKDVLTFKGPEEYGNVAVNGHPSTSNMPSRKGQKKRANIVPRKISFISNSNSDNFEGEIGINDVPASNGKTSSHRSKLASLQHSMQAQKDGCHESFHHSQSKDPHQSLVEPGLNVNEDLTYPTVRKDGDQPQDFGSNSPLSNTDRPQDSMDSLTLKINSPVSSPYPSSPKAQQTVKEVHSPALSEKNSPVGNIFHFRTSGASKEGGCAMNSEIDASDDSGAGIENFPEVHASPSEKVGKDGSRISQPFSDDGNFGSSDDGSSVATGETETLISETGARGRVEFNAAKRLRTEKRISKLSPSLSSPKGFDDHEWTEEPGENFSGDGYERVVMVFAFALENYVKKVKSATMSKSSKIMMDVSKEIHQKLQFIKMQIQEHVANLTSFSTSKRKRVELSFQEQAEQLKMIHEKFQQDIHQCLRNYNSIFEGLESHQNELKGTMKKQKAIHQKYLMQAEETLEKLLVDAKRKIEGVRKMEREKMVQLRYFVKECIK